MPLLYTQFLNHAAVVLLADTVSNVIVSTSLQVHLIPSTLFLNLDASTLSPYPLNLIRPTKGFPLAYVEPHLFKVRVTIQWRVYLL
ncbi:hypothetical protein CW304_26870 [Bacillus sp. UFRGS-B20]|nr:hypothetical protein CW304_26870 [Bacillus sp. UFRGS-B20]